MTSALCGEIIQQLIAAYPALRTEVLTTTAFGRPVQTLSIGDGPRKVLFSASHHANEWITTPVILRFMEELAEAARTGGRIYGVPAQNILKYNTIYTVPMVNPDGVDLVTGAIQTGTLEYETARRLADNYPDIPFPDGWKANLLGVDLNLQYPAGWLQAREIKFSQGFTAPAPRDYVLQLIEGWDLQMPVVYDWETVSSEDARTRDMDPKTLNACALAFCREIETAGYEAMVYFNLDLAKHMLDLLAIQSAGFDFWLAFYTEGLSYAYQVRMWQYTSSGYVPGIKTRVDMNLYFPDNFETFTWQTD